MKSLQRKLTHQQKGANLNGPKLDLARVQPQYKTGQVMAHSVN
jgi:hypothetical protein